jgi:hypothetical protein
LPNNLLFLLSFWISLVAGICPTFGKAITPEEVGLLYEANSANQSKAYHFDQVGNTIARTDDSGKVIGRAEYSAYGLITFKEGDMTTPSSTTAKPESRPTRTACSTCGPDTIAPI